MNTYLKLAGAALIGSLAFAAPSTAATIAGTCNTVSGQTELNALISCTQYDSGTYGPLNSVTLNIIGSITGSITLTNNSQTQSATGSGTTVSRFYLSSALPGFTPPLSVVPAPIGSPVPSAGEMFFAFFSTGSQTLDPLEQVTFNNLSGSEDTGNLVNANAGTFGFYTGVGNFQFNVKTISSLLVDGGGGNFQGGQSTNGEVTATVVYDYGVNTPEPASMAVLGAGMLALGFARRRRRA